MVIASPSPAVLAITGLSWILALGWLKAAVGALRGMKTLPDLTQLDPNTLPELDLGTAPHMTVVVPACNEQEAIQATLRSLLGSNGIRLQIVAVDDRSTDRTGALMEQVAAEAQRSGSPHTLQVIRNRALPDGWLGKPHAMHLAAQQARAPWLLFTDADLFFAPQALALALRHVLAEQADHLVLIPTLIRKGIGEAAMIANLQAPLAWAIRLWKVRDPRARDFMGVGGFNLIRAATYQQVGGFAALKMEVIEDMGLGARVKQVGCRSRVALGPHLVSIHWIVGLLGIVSNIEKNAFAAVRYRLIPAFFMCLALAIQVLAPLAVLFLGVWAWPSGVLTYAGIALMIRANRGLNGVSPWAALLFAPCSAIIWYAVVRSVVLTLVRGGVAWRGTLYPLAQLRREAAPWW